MIVIAHRGACHEATENTWAAFELCQQMGAERIELDVRLSQDGELIICHDDSLQRVFSLEYSVSQMTMKDIIKIRDENPDYHIPTLKDVLDHFYPTLGFHIEIKENNQELAYKVATLVQSYTGSSSLVLGSFYPEVLIHVRQGFPEQSVALIWDDITFSGSPKEAQELLGFSKYLDFHPHVDCLSKKMVEESHSLGGKVYPWIAYEGVSLEEEKNIWSKVIPLGVDGLCSNYPRQLLSWLKQKG